MTSSRRRALVAAGMLAVTGIALAAVFFPFMFDKWLPRDDEGVFVYALRESLAGHGHLYSTIWSDLYGPFYYLFMSTVFRVIHQQPSLENGRWITLVLTTASAALFGGSVWRVTKSLAASLVCEFAAFLVLVQVAGNVPMHPGSLGVLLIAVIVFASTSYAARRRRAHLVTIGIAVGALLMTKVNAGGLVAVALVFALLVGNRRTPRWLQVIVAISAALVPVALVSQNVFDIRNVGMLAALVSLSLIAMFVLMWIDPIDLTHWPLLPVAAGAAGAIVCSFAFPLVTGTPPSDVFSGVFIRPLTFGNELAVAPYVRLNWEAFVLTAVGIGVAVVFRSLPKDAIRAQATWTHATLAAVALWVLGLGVTTYASRWMIARWLPALVLLPAIAFCCDSSESTRLALRIVVALAALQILVAYPVPGTQVGWGTVAMVVPCAIALAVAADHSRVWRESGVLVQGGTVAFLCLGLLVASSISPVGVWRTYALNPKLGLPGTGLMRIDRKAAADVRGVVVQLRTQCDTFYGNPNLNSFYIFTGLPAVTGMLANGGTTGLTTNQQREVIDSLQEKTASGERVCILRDGTVSPVEGTPLSEALDQYRSVVATVGDYTISRHD